MGLILPGSPAFAYCSDNLASTPSTTVPAAQITSDAATNTDGTAGTILSALAHDCEYLIIGTSSPGASTVNTSSLMDVLVDPAGGTSWASFIDDLIAGYNQSMALTTSAFGLRLYHFPVWLPAGTSIGAQIRSATGSQTANVFAWAYGGVRQPASWWCGQKVETIGATPATSRGTTHTAGSTGAFSSWASLGSTIARDAHAIQFGLQSEGDTNTPAMTFHFEFGYSSTRIGPRIHHSQGAQEQVASYPQGPIFCNIPAGTQLQVRGTASGAPGTTDVAAYVVS